MNRPVTVVLGICALAIVLGLKFLNEVLLSVHLYGDNTAFVVGRIFGIVAVYAIPVFLLWKAWRGRNWARIVLAILVAINLFIVMSLARTVPVLLGVAPLWAVVLVMVEVLAITLLFAANRFYSKAGEHEAPHQRRADD